MSGKLYRVGRSVGLNRNVVVLSIARLADGVGNSILFVIIPLYVYQLPDKSFALPLPLLVGVLISAYGFAVGLLQPFTGALADRFGRYKLSIVVGGSSSSASCSSVSPPRSWGRCRLCSRLWLPGWRCRSLRACVPPLMGSAPIRRPASPSSPAPVIHLPMSADYRVLYYGRWKIEAFARSRRRLAGTSFRPAITAPRPNICSPTWRQSPSHGSTRCICNPAPPADTRPRSVRHSPGPSTKTPRQAAPSTGLGDDCQEPSTSDRSPVSVAAIPPIVG
jgi:hypothetical protein